MQPEIDPAPPLRPSLVGATRVELADALAGLGVPERERKMRVAQLWHWIYFQACVQYVRRDAEHRQAVARPLSSAAYTLARPAVVTEQVSADGTRKWLLRHRARRRRRDAPPRSSASTFPSAIAARSVHFEPGRLHAHLRLLPHRARSGSCATSPTAGDRRAARRRARPARRLSRPRRRRRTASFRHGAAPRRLEPRVHGHGRAALQFRGRARRDRRAVGRRRPVAVAPPHHRVHRRRRAEAARARRGSRRHARHLAPCRGATPCATRSCRSTANTRSATSSRRAAPIPAPPTRAASPSNTSC